MPAQRSTKTLFTYPVKGKESCRFPFDKTIRTADTTQPTS
ncbi:hypothetical protein EST38_g8932 [Candolleomyces aberdarensis]|uniref:Uncharacterized protein n=1 Tax=Candolleomyces aberdarensis TaxID=2316362 RepID=A0A4Q2DC15_9AGAR|nr:hypothetical protein EST38_g8932 [Candolleomyces aberdarensis]